MATAEGGSIGIYDSTETCLTDEDLVLVKNAIWRARSKWFSIGLELRISLDNLKIIAKKNGNDVDKCFIEMLSTWLKGTEPKPTWEILVEALNDCTVDEKKLATEIQSKQVELKQPASVGLAEAPLNTTDHYLAVRKALLKVKPQWRNIGLVLGIPLYQLNEFTGSISDKMDQMVEVWLNHTYSTPTWNALINALKDSTIEGGKPVAAEIMHSICTEQPLNQVTEDSSMVKKDEETNEDLPPLHCVDVPALKILELKPKMNTSSKLFRLKKGSILRFTIAPSLYARDIRLSTDYPTENAHHKMEELHELKWNYKGPYPHWDPDRFVEIQVNHPGSYRFRYTMSDTEEGWGYFVVESHFPEAVTCQTYITKLLGQLSEWKPKLEVARKCNYSMIHLTPIQKLGPSGSAYSIADHLKLDPAYLAPGYTHEIKTISHTTADGKTIELQLDSGYMDVMSLVDDMRNEWGVSSIVDVVWNHTSCDTPWLKEHPESCYNLVNSPHLRPAYALDKILAEFSKEIVNGKWESVGIGPAICKHDDIETICNTLFEAVFPQGRLWEYFCVDVEKIVQEFRAALYDLEEGSESQDDVHLEVKQDPHYRRLACTVDMDLVMKHFNIEFEGYTGFQERIDHCCAILQDRLLQLNRLKFKEIQEQLRRAANNIATVLSYQFLCRDGPQRKRATTSEPLFPRYFCTHCNGGDLSWDEIESEKGRLILVHDGWVSNPDPLVDFAEEGGMFFMREVILWEDVIKLHYGDKYEDSPWLWKHMKKYTQSMAYVFDGFRLNNCHNTPLHVSEWLLAAARHMKPELYVVAQLFCTEQAEEKRNLCVNRLNPNAIVAEALNKAIKSPLDVVKFLYQWGGSPVGSFLCPPHGSPLKENNPPTMLMDAAHDNEPGIIKERSVYDVLPNAAITAMCCCAIGSNRGYDELVPHVVDVVQETRHYTIWSDENPLSEIQTSLDMGIVAAKAELNALHQQLANEGFNQMFATQLATDVVEVVRHSPYTHESVYLVARCAFNEPPEWSIPTEYHIGVVLNYFLPLSTGVKLEEVILEAELVKKADISDFSKHSHVINGLESHMLRMRTHVHPFQSKMCHGISEGEDTVGVELYLHPGSIVILRTSLTKAASSAMQSIWNFLGKGRADAEGQQNLLELKSACSGLNLLDLNYALYHSEAEESDHIYGGAYEVPGAGRLVYCGLQGIVSMLSGVRDNNDLGHPICDNLRNGNWLAEYTVSRLKVRSETAELARVLSAFFGNLSQIPFYLRPCYFEAIISVTYNLLIESAVAKMSRFVQQGSSFVKQLALGSVQLVGVCQFVLLPPVRANEQPVPGLAAGLPHFATKCWGRETFIALRGLLLETGRHSEARSILLSYAACMRHGLIPNQMNAAYTSINPHYDGRDTPWWWLQSLQDYCKFVPDGHSILKEEVRKIFESDDAAPDFKREKTVPIFKIAQDILQRHVSGIAFNESHFGPRTEERMSSKGYQVSANVDLDNGFPFGGNAHNCGTWMNKIGGSSTSGNRGRPATPRDGSAIELVALCYSAVTWIAQLHEQKLYYYPGVRVFDHGMLTFSQWSERIKKEFESYFWIPPNTYTANVYRTGIYKDSHLSSNQIADFRLRPNFLIAVVVAPDLFTNENAWEALKEVETWLLGPLGIRTLDPDDVMGEYDGYYNTDDSYNYKIALGFNLHQGPEWIWLFGYYLRAKLHLAKKHGHSLKEVKSDIHRLLGSHVQAIRDSPWQGLTQLTNKDGTVCKDSCPVWAASMGCLLDALHDMEQTPTP